MVVPLHSQLLPRCLQFMKPLPRTWSLFLWGWLGGRIKKIRMLVHPFMWVICLTTSWCDQVGSLLSKDSFNFIHFIRVVGWRVCSVLWISLQSLAYLEIQDKGFSSLICLLLWIAFNQILPVIQDWEVVHNPQVQRPTFLSCHIFLRSNQTHLQTSKSFLLSCQNLLLNNLHKH